VATDPDTSPEIHDLIVIGGSASGLSVAVSSLKSGLKRVRIVEHDVEVTFPDLVGEHDLDVGYGERVTEIDMGSDGDDHVVLTTDRHRYLARGIVVADRHDDTSWRPTVDLPASDHIHIGDTDLPSGEHDVCVVGATDHAVELTVKYVAGGHNVVLAATGMDPSRLSPAGSSILRQLEHDRQATILYRSSPKSITVIDGHPLIEFFDRHTPDLQFDAVVFAPPRLLPYPADFPVSDEALASQRVWFVGAPDTSDNEPGTARPATVAAGNEIGVAIAEACFPEIDTSQIPSLTERRTRHAGVIDELRTEHYNATITRFDPHHSDLWVLRVKPDTGSTSFEPGQYASLGLGYWEARIDDADDPAADTRWDKLIRRSYSISSRIFDEHGYLADDTAAGELEFYIVLVKPTPDNTPALTPRLALKQPGDRIYLGPKVAGRYTTRSVTDPHAEVMFFGTGTGEAPHNPMAVELLRKGHVGPIVAAVTVREQSDLGYLDKHEQLSERYPNYHYVPMPTREPGIPKRYLQDLIRDDDFAERLGVAISPESTHFFLCGNPAMIGLPEDDDQGNLVFPETTGVVELLVERGFTLDRRGQPGNIHYEEYW
jgi:ferredoxin--NADP+ reductase